MNLFRKQDKELVEKPYIWLVVIILATILIILGFILLKRLLLPLAVSAIWSLMLNLIKDWVRNAFFSES